MPSIRRGWLAVSSYLLITVIESKAFSIYWNIPSFMCHRHNLPQINVTEKYGILQNENDSFRGAVISILYDPGNFPALLQNSSSGALVQRNGGVPQQGDIDDHLTVFRRHIDELMPEEGNNGLAIIDFESWRPVYRQNFGTLQPYRDLSEKIERQRHPFSPDRRIVAEATLNFEKSARTFMETSLAYARKLRPLAKWGYYGLPYCFNGRANNKEDCPYEVQREDDRTQWIYDASDVVYPSVYMSEQIAPADRVRMVRGRVKEAMRLTKQSHATNKPQVFAYFRYVFTDTKKFLSEKDTFDAFNAIKNLGGDGIILWGSSFDLNTKAKCIGFHKYLEHTLGPIAHSFQQRYSVDGI